MPRRLPIIAAVGLLLSAQAWSQTAGTLPPIAGPPREEDWFQQRSPPPEALPYRGQLPPLAPLKPPEYDRQGDRMWPTPVPPSPSAQELHASAERRDLRWRTVVEAEFAEWWLRQGCFPHPRRHGRWFDALAERLGAATPQQQHVLYGLVMERAEVHDPPQTQFRGLLGDAEEWVNGAMGWRAPGDLFCR